MQNLNGEYIYITILQKVKMQMAEINAKVGQFGC